MLTNVMAYTTVTDISSVTELFNTTVITGIVTVPFVGVAINATAKIIFIIVGLLEVVCGVAGNVLLLSALLVLGVDSYHLLFIANLAVSDLLDLILGYHPVVNRAHCQANSFVVHACSAVSILSLTSISLNRYLHVCHNHLYSGVFSRRRIIIWCLVLWLVAAVVCIPPLFGVGSYGYDPFSHTCSSLTNESENLYVNATVTSFCSLSVIWVGYCNFAIFRYWKRFKLNIDRRFSLSPDNRGITSRLKRNQGESEEETELDTLQEGHPKELDSNALQASENNRNTTGAQQRLSHGRCEESRILNDQGQHVGQPRSEDATSVLDDRKLLVARSVFSEKEFPPVTNSASRISDVKHVSATLPAKVECTLEVLSDIDSHHHITSSPQYEMRIYKERERERAFVRSLCVVFLLMFFCFIPFGVVETVVANSPQPPEVVIPAALLLFLNNSVNWIVYGVMNRSFRRAYFRHVIVKCGLDAARANRSSEYTTPATDTN